MIHGNKQNIILRNNMTKECAIIDVPVAIGYRENKKKRRRVSSTKTNVEFISYKQKNS